MNNKVTRFHLHEFLHGESHLAGPCLVALEVVLVESVEYLVVGEKAGVQLMVYEALVQGLVNSIERYRRSCREAFRRFAVVPRLVEDVAQSLLLLLAVGKHI